MVTREQIQAQLDNCLLEAKFPQWESRYKRGKVRDMYFARKPSRADHYGSPERIRPRARHHSSQGPSAQPHRPVLV